MNKVHSACLVGIAFSLACGYGPASQGASRYKSQYELIPGNIPADRQPDGNSIILDAPKGLIVIDTGRHQEQQDKILAYARTAGKPIVAIVNTHWHLDHSGGNAELKQVYPNAAIYTSRAIEGALAGFLANNKKEAEAYIASGAADAAQRAEIEHDFAAIDERVSLLPTVPVTRSGAMKIAGRRLQVNLAPYAATEGDVWVYDPATKTVFAGDLVVGQVPFMDTACPEGWRKALGLIEQTPFTTLVPGHGEPMSRAQFGQWRAAFNNLLDCAAGSAADAECVAGWQKDAAPFLTGTDSRRIGGMVKYYLTSRLRSATGRKQYCPRPA